MQVLGLTSLARRVKQLEASRTFFFGSSSGTEQSPEFFFPHVWSIPSLVATLSLDITCIILTCIMGINIFPQMVVFHGGSMLISVSQAQEAKDVAERSLGSPAFRMAVTGRWMLLETCVGKVIG